MANNTGLNLNNLKAEIEQRKKEQRDTSMKLGEPVRENAVPKNGFLYSLQQSVNNGQESHATKMIKLVENKTAVIKDEKPIYSDVELASHKHSDVAAIPNKKEKIPIAQSIDERDDVYDKQFEELKNEIRAKRGLAEAMNEYVPQSSDKKQSFETPHLNNVLNESIEAVIDKKLMENFEMLAEDAVKNTIVEIYAIERIKNVLQENNELLRTKIFEIIREPAFKREIKGLLMEIIRESKTKKS